MATPQRPKDQLEPQNNLRIGRGRGGLDRRQFLKVMLGTAVSLAVPGADRTSESDEPAAPFEEISQVVHDPESEKKAEVLRDWKMEEILAKPAAFLEYVLNFIAQNPADSPEYQAQNEKFLSFWLGNGAEHLRTIEACFATKDADGKTLSEKIIATYQATEQLSKYGQYIQARFYKFTSPWNLLSYDFGTMSDARKYVSHWAGEQLLELYQYIAPLARFGTNHKPYDDRANLWLEEHGETLDSNIDVVWNMLQKTSLPIPEELMNDSTQHRTAESRQAFDMIRSTYNEYFPYAEIGISHQDFSTWHRAYYLPKQDFPKKPAGIFGGSYFFDAVEAEKSGAAGIADQYISLELTVLAHEKMHHYDPTRDFEEWKHFHPFDLLNYIESYTRTYQKITNFVDNATTQETVWWFLDPLTPKSLGTDELRTPEQAQNVIAELREMGNFCNWLKTWVANHPDQLGWVSKHLPLIQGSADGKNLLWWQILLDEKLTANTERFISGTYDVILPYQFDGITDAFTPERQARMNTLSAEHMNDLIDIIQELQGNPDAYKDLSGAVAEVLIVTKSYYIFAFYMLLQDMKKLPQATFSSDEYNTFTTIYNSIATKVWYQLGHCLVGPIGEYMPALFNPFFLTLAVHQGKQLSIALDEAHMYRDELKNILEEAGYTYQPDWNVSPTADDFQAAMLYTQRARAMLMGVRPEYQAEDPTDAFVELHDAVTRNLRERCDWKNITLSDEPGSIRSLYEEEYKKY